MSMMTLCTFSDSSDLIAAASSDHSAMSAASLGDMTMATDLTTPVTASVTPSVTAEMPKPGIPDSLAITPKQQVGLFIVFKSF